MDKRKNANGHSVLHARAISDDGEMLSNVTIFISRTRIYLVPE